MSAALLLGGVAGLGLLVAGRALVPGTPRLDDLLRTFDREELAASPTTDDDATGRALGPTLGAWAARGLARLGLARVGLHPDLRLVGRTVEEHLGEKVLLAVFGFLLPTASAALALLGGAAVPIVAPLGAGIVLGAAFFFVPDLTLRSQAAARRAGFRHALGSFLDLAVIGLAGGAGVEGAIRDAAAVGGGWSFAQLRGALAATNLTGETVWTALARLGRELDVPEVVEMAASVALAGTEGARVRESLAAKAATLRDRALAETEAEAQSATERMAVPVVLLFLGFLVLIGYPALSTVLQDF